MNSRTDARKRRRVPGTKLWLGYTFPLESKGHDSGSHARRGRIVGLVRRFAKPLYPQGYREFESLPLRHILIW